MLIAHNATNGCHLNLGSYGEHFEWAIGIYRTFGIWRHVRKSTKVQFLCALNSDKRQKKRHFCFDLTKEVCCYSVQFKYHRARFNISFLQCIDTSHAWGVKIAIIITNRHNRQKMCVGWGYLVKIDKICVCVGGGTL